MVSWCKSFFYSIVILHVSLTWVSAQDDANVTSSAEVANSSLADEGTPTQVNVQNDQETPQKSVETLPPTLAAVTEVVAEETVKPTRQPNLAPTTPPPVVRMDPTSTVEQEKKNGSTKGTASPTKKADGGHAGISVANLALVVFSVSALLIY